MLLLVKRNGRMATMNNNKNSVSIIFIAWFAYLISYIGRSDYSACILEIVNEMGVTRATAGMVSSVFAMCNAVGQLVCGLIMRKISPIKVIGIELFTVSIINFIFPLAGSFPLMAVLWGINGAMQATLLCGISQIFANSLKEPYLSRGAILLNTIGAAGGLFNYLLSWLMIRYFNWQVVFFAVSGMLVVLGVIWVSVMPRYCQENRSSIIVERKGREVEQPVSLTRVISSHGSIFVIAGAFFVGGLRESVSLWIPSYMNEVFGLSSSLSTVVTAVVPCFQICGAFLAGYIGRKTRTLHLPTTVAFVFSTICLLLIRLLGGASPVTTISLFVFNAVSMTAAITFLLSLFPVRYAEKTSIAMLVGMINFSVHAGDFAASVGIGWLSQSGGWQYTFAALCAAAAIGALICLLGGIVCLNEVKTDV